MIEQQIIELSNQHKVALPMFSVKLMSLVGKTTLAWNVNIIDNTGRYTVNGLKMDNDTGFALKVPALTIQDVMNLLPQNIEYDTTYSLFVSKYSVWYENSLGQTKHNFTVIDNNIVNALCELYFLLKSEKVIV